MSMYTKGVAIPVAKCDINYRSRSSSAGTASREWFSLIRTAVLEFVAKLGVRFLKPSDTDTDILELDMHGCITTTVNYVLDSLKAEYAKRSASNEELNIKMEKKRALLAFRPQSLGSQYQQMARYFSAAPTLELERCRLYTTWLGQPYPVPNNTKYLQYPTRDVQVRLQQLLEGVQSPITMLMCLPNAAACANSKSAYKSMWSPQCAMTKLRTTNAHATCYIGVQLGNRLLCKSQDPRRKSPKIVAAKA
eukprot:3597-Heterococcus_DN1.PRE.2